MPEFQLTLQGGAALSVRRFEVQEAISSPFTVSIWARSDDPALDLGAISGAPGSLTVGLDGGGGGRTWSGIVSFVQQQRADPNGLSTYFLRIVPRLWLLTQRKNHRMFQHLTIPEIIDELLEEWGIERVWAIDREAYPPLELRVQWGETDDAFFCRMLEEAGISFVVPDDASGSTVKLVDEPHRAEPRAGALRWMEDPGRADAGIPYVTNVGVGHEVRPGAMQVRDYDFRRPSYELSGKGKPAEGPEARYEQFLYKPGISAIDVDVGDWTETPVADDRGGVRHDDEHAERRASRGLEGERAGRTNIGFDSNVVELAPGTVFTIANHPHDVVATPMLVIELKTEGDHSDTVRTSGRAAQATAPWKPRLATPKPRVRGVQSATVVGPPGDEIHTDELGRIRVEFPWDRESTRDEFSSCWMRISQGWGGASYGLMTLPRVGQEVLVDFIDGNPDMPIVVGRVFNATQPVPYKLPENKTQSGWKSNSSPEGAGFNEILFEDKKGEELFSQRAERDLRKLVKNDETITVGRDREKHVTTHEMDTTGEDRTEVVQGDRTEVTSANRIALVEGNRKKLVKGQRVTSTERVHMRHVVGNCDIVVKGRKRDRVSSEVHARVNGERRESIGGKHSLSVAEDRVEKSKGATLFDVAGSTHLAAGEDLGLDAKQGVTFKGAGGFVRFGKDGITIEGKAVRINAGGAPGKVAKPSPDAPEAPAEAEVNMPEVPEPPPQPKPPAGTNWIELSVVQEDAPKVGASFARYRMELPDGSTMEGRLDAAGRMIAVGMPAGPCKVTFPDLDGDALKE
jgi:type VI secretion system secreted protein VgrG